jgi:hypothetical protein
MIDDTRDISIQLRRPASEEKPLPAFKISLPSQEFLPSLNRSINFILRSLSKEPRNGHCLRLQFRQCGTTFPANLEVGPNGTHS